LRPLIGEGGAWRDEYRGALPQKKKWKALSDYGSRSGSERREGEAKLRYVGSSFRKHGLKGLCMNCLRLHWEGRKNKAGHIVRKTRHREERLTKKGRELWRGGERGEKIYA